MPWGIDLNPFDEEKPKRPKVPRSRSHDVPIPKSRRAAVERKAKANRARIAREKRERDRREREERERDRVGWKDLVVPGAAFGKVAGPILGKAHAPKILRSIPEDVAELGAGLLPAAKTVGGITWRDAKKLAKHHDMPSREDAAKYMDLMKWVVSDGKKKKPGTDSEIVGLIAEMTRAWGRGIERAIPDPTSAADMKEFRKAWTEDPIFSLLDVLPFAAAITRPLSVAKHTRGISRANDISKGKALATGVKESYRPGAARREGLKGGIEPRVLRAEVGGKTVEVGGRPWSRIPAIREIQRATDEAYNLSGGASRKRVGRAEERLAREEKRRITLGQKELERPIGELLYGRVGRNLGAFGLKSGMTAKERRVATGLAYAFQMPKWMDPADALAAVQDDLSAVLKDGHMEVPKGRGRVKRLPLNEAEKQNLAIQISDLDIVRKELDDGDLTPDEWSAAMDAMGTMAGKTEEMGLEIMQRRYNLDADEMDDLQAAWKTRSEIIPRRLAARGQISGRDLADSPVRAKRLEELTQLLDEDQARFLVSLTDTRARAVRPDDPSAYWEERIGDPTGETAQEYVTRMGDEALFPQMDDGTGLIDALEAGINRHLLDTGEFYSPLQKWVDETMPDEMPAAQMRGSLRSDKSPVSKDEYDNANIDNFFADRDPKEIVTKAEFQAHMANPLNAYNLKEILLSNHLDNDFDMGTVFDIEHGANYMSRDPRPGEYFELLLQLPGPPMYKGKGYGHWQRHNIAAHVRFHIFEEDGVRKLLIEEIQSDWANEWRVARSEGKEHRVREPEEQREFDALNERIEAVEAERAALSQDVARLDSDIRAGEGNTTLMEYQYRDAQQQLVDLRAEAGELEQSLEYLNEEFGLTEVPRSPLGTGISPKSSYLNPTIRWLLRRADEADVDEIHLVGRETQLVRNAEVLDSDEWERLTQTADGGAEMVTDYVRTLIDDGHYTDRSFLGYEHDLPNIISREMGGVEGRKVPDGYDGTYRHPLRRDEDGFGRMPSTVFTMTDEAKVLARKPKSMYQRQPDWKGLPHGAAELLDKGTRIHMFETGNVSTWIHELGHVGLYDLSADDLRVIETHVGGGFKLGDWTSMEHERFARSFEQYVRKGKAPNKELATVFGKLSEWMKAIWKESKIRKSEDIPDPVREVFDRMFDDGKPLRGEFDTHGYFPQRDIHAQAQTDYRGGVRPPAAGQTIGVPRMAGDTVQRNTNELLLYQGGAMSPDPGGLVNVFLNRLRFKETLNARDELWEVGHPMTERPPKGAWLIRNPDATPERIKPQAQAAVRGEEAARPVEDLEEMLRLDPEEFRKEVIARAGEEPKWAADMENVRWVEGDYVETRFGEVFEQKPRGKMWSAMGLLTSMQRATGIYGRPISYIGGNVPFNVAALMTQMPVSTLRNASRAFDIRKNDPALWRAMNSESGETRAGGGLPERYVRAQNRTQAAEQKATQIQRGMAEKLSGVADDPFRSIAFLNNARKRGYRTNADLKRLIKENGTDLHEVRQLVREQMLDFDALNPSQRRIASQFLYLWPFMYASIKWPAMFAREYPARAAVGANLIEREPERKLPQEITNLWKRFGIDLTTINPIGPLGQVAEDVQTSIADPSKLDLTALQERLSPTLGAVSEGLAGGRKNAAVNFIRGTVPGAAEYFSSDPEFRGAKIYKDRSRQSYLGQRHFRYWPRGINKERLGEMVEQAVKDKIAGSTIEKEMKGDWEKIGKYAKAVGGYTEEDVTEVRRSYQSWWEYQEAVEQKKDSLGQRKLTPYQQIEVLQPIVEEHYPELQGDLWDMERMQDEEYQRKYAKALDDYASALKDKINEGRTMIFNDYRSYGPESD